MSAGVSRYRFLKWQGLKYIVIPHPKSWSYSAPAVPPPPLRFVRHGLCVTSSSHGSVLIIQMLINRRSSGIRCKQGRCKQSTVVAGSWMVCLAVSMFTLSYRFIKYFYITLKYYKFINQQQTLLSCTTSFGSGI